MDRDFEDEWNIFDGFVVPSSSNSHFGLHSGNVQDSTRSVATRNNQAQTTESYENLVAPPLALDDPNPLFRSPNSSAPIANATLGNQLFSSVVGLIPDGAASSIQDQQMVPISSYNPFYQSQTENLHMLNQDLGISNEYTTSNQLLEPNIIANITCNDINQHSSFQTSTLFPQDAVEAGPRIGTGSISNEQFMNNQRSMLSPLQNDDPRAWNTRAPQNQLSTVNAYDSGYTSPNYRLHDSSASHRQTLYPDHHSHSQFATTYNFLGSESSVPPRPERATGGIQIQRGAPISRNTASTRRDQAIILESSSFGAQPPATSLNMLNQYAIPEVTSSAPSTTLLRDQSLNLQTGRLQRDSPIATSQEAYNRAPQNEEMNYDQNNNALSSYTDPRQILNAAYDPAYVRRGLPVDPHIRAWQSRRRH